MAQPNPGLEVVPRPSEVALSVRLWQQELDRINEHWEHIKQSDRQEFEAEKAFIERSVRQKREEQIYKLNEDIHQYMIDVQEGIDALLVELKTEKFARLEAGLTERLRQRDFVREQSLLDHLKKYKSILQDLDAAEDDDLQSILPAPHSQATSNRNLGAVAAGADGPTKHHLNGAAVARAAEEPGVAVGTTNSAAEDLTGRARTSEIPAFNDRFRNQPDHLAHSPLRTGVNRVVDPPSMIPIRDVKMDRERFGLLNERQLKRKSTEEPEVGQSDTGKRARMKVQDIVNSEAPTTAPPLPASLPLPPPPPQTPHQPRLQAGAPTPRAERRTISFDEVYQDGNAEFKHIIVEFPPASQKWYIMKCDEHGVHFGKKPLLGAAKHLHGSQHNNQQKHHTLAVELLGHWVWDCDAELAAKNNLIVMRAMDRGYVPFNINRLTKQEKISQGILLPEISSTVRQVNILPAPEPSLERQPANEIEDGDLDMADADTSRTARASSSRSSSRDGPLDSDKAEQPSSEELRPSVHEASSSPDLSSPPSISSASSAGSASSSQQSAQDIAAQALHFSPELQAAPSPPTAKAQPLPRVTTIKDLLVAEVSPIRFRPDGPAVAGLSKSASPPAQLSKLVSEVRSSSAQPLHDRLFTPPLPHRAAPSSTAEASEHTPRTEAQPAEKGQDFDIVSYHSDNRRWVREEGGPCLRLSIDPKRKVAESGPSESLHILIDPSLIVRIVLHQMDLADRTVVKLLMKEGPTKLQRLIFAARDKAQQLAQWVRTVNPAVVYRSPDSESLVHEGHPSPVITPPVAGQESG